METIFIVILAIIVIVVAIFVKNKKSNSSNSNNSVTNEQEQEQGILHATDYANSFFSGMLAGTPIHPYTLPEGVKGYGINGVYDSNSFDPAFYDSKLERINAANGTYVDIPNLTINFLDGSTDKITREEMRAWLYSLSIDPNSIKNASATDLALLNAPRSIDKNKLNSNQGTFGG